MPLSILYVGSLSGTSAHRAQALEELGHRVCRIEAGPPERLWSAQLYRIGHHLHRPPDLLGTRRRLLEVLGSEHFDLIWVDKGRTIGARTLRAARRLAPRAFQVSYSPDDMTKWAWNSAQYLACVPLYDLHVTTKSYNVPELAQLGAREVMFVDNAFDPATHRPLELSAEEVVEYGCQVGFVGFFEEERARHIRDLARAGIAVSVRGPRWNRLRDRPPELRLRSQYLDGLDYSRAINATRINLGFLRKAARDLQTTRSVEIPACGGFLLAERTEEHQRLFQEGREAEFFEGFEELLAKCRYFLAHEDERRRIAAAGRRRCLEGGYSNAERLRGVLEHIAGMADASNR